MVINENSVIRMIQCSNCGTMNDDGSKFCTNCGNSLPQSVFNGTLEPSKGRYNGQRGQNDPRRIDDGQPVNNQQQTYQSRGQNDPRRIDESRHVPSQPQTSTSRGQNDPRRIDETKHRSKNPAATNIPQTTNQQQRTGQQQRTNTQSNGSIMDKLSNLSTPVKIIGVILCCCIGILIVSSLMGGVSDQGSLPSSSNYQDTNSYSDVFDSFSRSACKEINYKELNKNPDRYDGTNLKLSGRIMQISEGHSDGNFMLMYVNDDYNQLAYVEYYNDTNFVEDDWVTVYGVGAGSYSYSTTSGGYNTVPAVYGAILE